MVYILRIPPPPSPWGVGYGEHQGKILAFTGVYIFKNPPSRPPSPGGVGYGEHQGKILAFTGVNIFKNSLPPVPHHPGD